LRWAKFPAQGVIGSGAMRAGGIGAFDVLLRASGSERRELAIDAGDRRALPQATVLRLAADDGLAWRSRVGGQREAGGAVDAGDGIAGERARTPHQPAPSRASDIPVLAAGSGGRATQSGVVLGHHVRADAARVISPRSKSTLPQVSFKSSPCLIPVLRARITSG